MSKLPAHRWCTTQAPAGPDARLLHGWDALGGLLLQLVAHDRIALDALIASTLDMLWRRDLKQDR